MSQEEFQRLVLRGIWAILFCLIRHHAGMAPSQRVEDIEIELRDYSR